MKYLIYFISWFTIIAAISVILLSGYWLVYPYKVIEYRNLPHKTDKQVYKNGEQIIMSVEFCRYMPVVPEINRSFTDGLVYNIHGTVSPTSDVGCYERKVIIPVPITLPPGKYHITNNYRFDVNPIRTIEVSTKSETFTVIR